MSFDANFYQFSKKKNSTKVPSGNGTPFAIEILEPSSVLSPTIRLKTSNPVNFNYCRISTYNRYYFVTDWTSDHNTWIAHLSVDVLATYASDILATRQYVLRSGSEHDEFIIDDAYIMTKEVTCNVVGVPDLPRDAFFTTASYLFAISNNEVAKPKINGIQYLVCNINEAREFMALVLNGQSTYWNTGSSEITDDIARSIINPLQYVSHAYILPFQLDDGDLADIETLKLGPWNIGEFSCKSLSAHAAPVSMWGGQVYQKTITVELPAHDQLLTQVVPDYGIYLNGEPFTERYLYAGPFGMIKLDSNMLVNIEESVSIDITVRCDFLGNAVCIVSIPNSSTILTPGAEIARAYANIAVPVPLTQSKNDVLSWVGTFGGAVASAAQLNIGGTIAGAAKAISGVDSVYNKPEVKGVQGSLMQTYDRWFVQSEFRHVSGNGYLANYHEGRPLMQMKILSDLSGFTICGKPYLALDCYEPEYNQVIDYMTNGFYIEGD